MMNREVAIRIIERYKYAWESQDSEAILQIFHEDAVYHEHAYQPRMSGLAEIERYWNAKVKHEQANIEFRLLNLFIDGSVAVAEWQCEFDEPMKRRRIQIKEVAIIEIVGEKIKSLREYWASRLVRDWA